jgi:Ca2+-binding EF-hand superfamily protein
MKLANEDLSLIKNTWVINRDARRIKMVVQNFHKDDNDQQGQIAKENLVDYIGITYNKK